MKRIVRLGMLMCFVFSVFSLYIPKITYAFVDIPDYIRIGLEYKYKDVNQIEIKNNELLVGYDVNGEFIPEGLLQSNTGFYIMPSKGYFISINDVFNTYDDATAVAEKLRISGVEAFPASIGHSQWTVFAGEFQSLVDAKNMIGIATNLSSIDFIVKEPVSTRTILYNHNGIVSVFEGEDAYPQFQGLISNSGEEIIDLGDRQYRGRMEFGRYNGGGITAINVVLFDEYLYGVVPGEMPASWDIEALKAQAVVARNYAYTSMGKHQNSGYDLCDTNHCQVYKGYGAEDQSSNLAVDETSGEFLYYDDEIITTFYFSSSGGYTESSENVWTASLPYLKAVPDTYEETSKTWTRTFSKKQIEDLLRNNGKTIGQVVDVKIESYTSGGRVKELTIIGTNGYESLTKENIRYFFKTNGVSLESRMFNIIKNEVGTNSMDSLSIIGSDSKVSQNVDLDSLSVIDADGRIQRISVTNSSVNVQRENGIDELSFSTPMPTITGDFVFQGKGWGHGVGMSQWGAKGMADQGYSYKEILSYYYTGSSVH